MRFFRSLSPCVAALLSTACAPPAVAPPPSVIPAGPPVVAPGATDALGALMTAARTDSRAWERLEALCDGIGHRLAGSDSLAAATVWAEGVLREDGHEAVAREPVTVPVWQRGEESLQMLAPVVRPLAMLGLGRSIGTDGPVEAPVVVISDFSELGPHVADKVVLYNVPMAEGSPTHKRYGPAVAYRGNGASAAAEHGARAALVRSVTTRSLYTPHTGALRYDPKKPKIPAAAITTEDAAMIARLTEAGETVQVRLEMGAQTLPDAQSHNVLAQITGARSPEEIVLIGAHLDSWDVGQGAHDDGAGVVQVIEALRLIRALDEPPGRTIRVVLYTNEENGLAGGRTYASEHAGERHVAAIESDLGGGWPLAWSAGGTEEQMAWLRQTAAPLGMPISEGGGGADIGPLKAHGTLVIGLRPDDTHYFDVHHTWADTLEKVDPESLREGAAAVAGLAWLLAI